MIGFKAHGIIIRKTRCTVGPDCGIYVCQSNLSGDDKSGIKQPPTDTFSAGIKCNLGPDNPPTRGDIIGVFCLCQLERLKSQHHPVSMRVQCNSACQLICGRNIVRCHIGRVTGAVTVPRHNDSGQNAAYTLCVLRNGGTYLQ